MTLPPEELADLLASLPEPDIIRAEQARRSYAKFVRLFWPIIEPLTPLRWNWHLDAICEHLEAVARGEVRRLLINVPPGHSKTTLVSAMWPAWEWASNPGLSSIHATYGHDLSVGASIKCRAIIESPLYQRAYCQARDWGLRHDQNRLDYYKNTKGGERIATSVGGGGTGLRADRVVGDDLIKVAEARSKPALEAAIAFWDKTLGTRAKDSKTFAQVMIAQRVHEDDPPGHLLRRGGYEHLCLPTEFDPKRRSVTMGGRWQDPREERGELLFPGFLDREAVADAKLSLGSDGYAAQHDQLPSPAEGGMFKRGWWKHIAWSEFIKGPIDEWAASLDCTFKDSAKSDFVVCQVWARRGAMAYLRKQYRGRKDVVATCELVERVKKEFPEVAAFLVEDKANGPAVLRTLRDVVPGLIPVDPGARNKESRAAAVTPFVEAGNVWLPFHGQSDWENDGWTGTRGEEPVGAFLEEMSAFPKSRHDDQCDALSQMLDRWRHAFARTPIRVMQPPRRAPRTGVDM